MREPLRVGVRELTLILRGAIPVLVVAATYAAHAQAPAQSPESPGTVKQAAPDAMPVPLPHPIAIVPLDSAIPGHALEVTGDLTVANGRAVVAASASIVSGGQATQVTLPYRGTLQVCAYTTVKITADTSVPTDEVPGLMMAMEHGAMEMSFAAGRANLRNADMLLTPDFRILINGQGPADVKVRLGPKGDTCIDNPGANAPYVVVSSVFEGGAYRVQPGQRVMFQHGSLHEVVDEEKEPCGCPPPEPKGNEFPLAQSEGLAPLARPVPTPEPPVDTTPAPVAPLVYKSADHAAQQAAPPPETKTESPTPAAAPAAAEKKAGFFKRVGRFFKKIFGAE